MALLDFSGSEDPTNPSWAMGMQPPPPVMPPVANSGFLDRMLNAIRHVESNGNPNAVSPAGAVGPYQIMPKTAANPGYGVQPLAPDQLTQEGPARKFAGDYIKALYTKLGSWPAAFAAYNGGMKQGLNFNAGAPMPAETTNYVPAVQKAMETGAPAAAGIRGDLPSPASPMAVGYDAAQDGPGGPVPPVAPPANSPVPQNVGTDGGSGAGMPQVSDTPLPPQAPAPAPQQASAGNVAPPSMQEYMRSMSNGGDTTMGRIGDALMAVGAGLPGNGMRGTAQTLLQMSMLRKERMLDAQQKMYPQMMAYNALVAQGVKPDQAMLQAFAPGSIGKWEVKQVGTDSTGNPIFIQENSLTGESRPVSGDVLNKAGIDGGAGSVPNSLVGPDRLKALEEKDPGFASLLQQGLAGEINPLKDMRFMRSPQLMTNYLRNLDLATRDPNNPNELGDYDPAKMEAARKQYSELSDMKTGSPGAIVRGADQGMLHFGQMISAFDDANKNGNNPLDSKSWGPLTSILNDGKVSWAKLNADPTAAAKLPPMLGAAYETAKFFKGTGALSDADAEHFMSVFRPGMSRQEQDAAFKEVGGMIEHAYETYYNKYQENPKSFRNRYPFPANFSPGSISVFKRLGIKPAGVADDAWDKTTALGTSAAPPPIDQRVVGKTTTTINGKDYLWNTVGGKTGWVPAQ